MSSINIICGKKMTYIQEKLFELQDEKYAAFQSRLTPNVDPKIFIGVRVPECRKLAKKLFINEPDAVTGFLSELPHLYYDENMLHGLLISEIKDFDKCIEYVEAFLPYVDNWAVCDIMSPRCFKKHKEKLISFIQAWIRSADEYAVRFGIEMMMSHFLDDDFDSEYLKMVSTVRSDKYYVNMMLAWFFATALAKQWDSTVTYIENCELDPWVHNKTIQKARESYRITDDQKKYLQGLKR